MQRKAPLVVLAFVAVSLIWGSTYLGIRVALESFPPFLIGAIRFVGAGALLFAVAKLRGDPLREPRVALGGTDRSSFLRRRQWLGERRRKSVSSGLASVLVATMPLWTALLSRLFGERASAAELSGVLLGLVGVAIMNLGGELRASPGGTIAALHGSNGLGARLGRQQAPLAATRDHAGGRSDADRRARAGSGQPGGRRAVTGRRHHACSWRCSI